MTTLTSPATAETSLEHLARLFTETTAEQPEPVVDLVKRRRQIRAAVIITALVLAGSAAVPASSAVADSIHTSTAKQRTIQNFADARAAVILGSTKKEASVFSASLAGLPELGSIVRPSAVIDLQDARAALSGAVAGTSLSAVTAARTAVSLNLDAVVVSALGRETVAVSSSPGASSDAVAAVNAASAALTNAKPADVPAALRALVSARSALTASESAAVTAAKAAATAKAAARAAAAAQAAADAATAAKAKLDATIAAAVDQAVAKAQAAADAEAAKVAAALAAETAAKPAVPITK
jgi:hypothetical protein